MNFISQLNDSKLPLILALCVTISEASSQNLVRINYVPELTVATAHLWNKGIIQHGIIGNDFRGVQKIGNAAAERYQSPGVPAPDFWFPIDTIKRTMGGELERLYVYNPTIPGTNYHVGDDYDHNLNIVPTSDYAADFKYSIDKAVERMNKDDPFVDASIEAELDCEKSDYENYRVRFMQLEIDLHKSNARSFFDAGKPHAPRVKNGTSRGDIVFGYGPWISDAGHCYKPEIHPAEQIWWRTAFSNTHAIHYLLLTCDQSDRFDDKEEFDDDEIYGSDRYLANVWAPRPLKGIFALQFSLDPTKEVLKLDLTRIGGQGISSSYKDGKVNYLIYKGDTVAIVHEPAGSDVLKVGFEKLHNGLDKKTIYGYITIQTIVGEEKTGLFDDSEGGYIFLKSELKKLARKQMKANTNIKFN